MAPSRSNEDVHASPSSRPGKSAALRLAGAGSQNGKGLAAARHERREWLAAPFQQITLAQLNAKADMLERLDNKYVVRDDILQQAVPLLSQYFDILEIEGRRAFTYDTCYFDDSQHTSYFDHHRGRRQRCKVRVRRYTDSQTCFVEIKLKDKRGITVKKRMDYPIEKYGTLDERALAMIQKEYREFYGRDFDLVLQPALDIRYQRVTLVAKAGGERMTIDSRLVFSKANLSKPIDENVFVIETKSANGNGIADKILRGLHQHRTSGCSKYCLGAVSLGVVIKYNNFLPAFRKFHAALGERETVRPVGSGVRQSAGRGIAAMLPNLVTGDAT